MRLNQPPMVASAALFALACGDGPPAPLDVARVAGCYEVTDSAGHRFGSARGFWAAVVRLDTLRRPGDADAGEPAEPGDYVAITTAPVEAGDTAFYTASWHILPPDTLVISRNSRFMGERLQLVRVGDSFVGRAASFGDVADSASTRPGVGVRARRVSCPAVHQPASRPVA